MSSESYRCRWLKGCLCVLPPRSVPRHFSLSPFGRQIKHHYLPVQKMSEVQLPEFVSCYILHQITISVNLSEHGWNSQNNRTRFYHIARHLICITPHQTLLPPKPTVYFCVQSKWYAFQETNHLCSQNPVVGVMHSGNLGRNHVLCN